MDIEFIFAVVGSVAAIIIHDIITQFIVKDRETRYSIRYYMLVVLILVIGLNIYHEVDAIRSIDTDQACKAMYNIY